MSWIVPLKEKSVVKPNRIWSQLTDYIGDINGSGERIRTSDLRVMRPMHGFVMVCYLLLSSVMECDSPRVPA